MIYSSDKLNKEKLDSLDNIKYSKLETSLDQISKVQAITKKLRDTGLTENAEYDEIKGVEFDKITT